MDALLLILSLCLKIFTIYFAVIAVFALWPRRKYPAAAARTRFAVVIAARNEEPVIADLVHSLLQQEYPRHLRDVFVVPNNCTDYTEAVARAAGAEIIHCADPVSSKGEALHQAFLQLNDRGYDAYVIFDADNIAAPDYLARINDAVCAGATVWKGRIKAANPTAAGVAGCYGLYNTCFDIIWNRPRAVCGLSAKLVGTGFGFTRKVLEELGGWNTSTIAEDAEFAAQCARRGHRVWWVPEAVSYDRTYQFSSVPAAEKTLVQRCDAGRQKGASPDLESPGCESDAALGSDDVSLGAFFPGSFSAADGRLPDGPPAAGRNRGSCCSTGLPDSLLLIRRGNKHGALHFGRIQSAGHGSGYRYISYIYGVLAAPSGAFSVL